MAQKLQEPLNGRDVVRCVERVRLGVDEVGGVSVEVLDVHGEDGALDLAFDDDRAGWVGGCGCSEVGLPEDAACHGGVSEVMERTLSDGEDFTFAVDDVELV